MDILGPIGPIDTDMALEFRRQGVLERLLSCIRYILPDPPVSAAARLFALPPHDDVDRLSCLPGVLLGNIVSRLPVKDAARTAALSHRWRGVWRSAPLILVDADLLPVDSTAGARADARRVTSAVSCVLAAHPGPFRCFHLTSSYLEEFHGPLTRWFELLVANVPRHGWPLACHLLPNLLELGLCGIFMETKDLDYILDRSPVLEMLYVEINLFKLSLRLVSQSLRCVLLIGCFFEEIFVVDAPRLERLILSEACIPQDSCTKVKIGHAPKLHLLGCLELDPRTQLLEVGNTVIKGMTRVSPSTMVPSVRILALEVRFGVRNDAKLIPSVLRCFPNVETLHIKSGDTDQSTRKLNLKFWHESGTIECIRSSIKLLVFHDFRGDRSELAFLNFFFENALVLKKAVILLGPEFTSMEEVHSKVASLQSMKWASKTSSVLVTNCCDDEGGYIRSLKRGSDFSLRDPFANY
ncbi:unnamed protein product [Alopecurus aequalis]